MLVLMLLYSESISRMNFTISSDFNDFLFGDDVARHYD